MPRNKKAEKPPFKLNGFVVCNLGEAEKKEAKAWIAENAGELWFILERVVLSGYKFSLSHDGFHDAVLGSLTCTDSDKADCGWCLTGRAPDALSALGMVLYKHTVMLDGEWQSRRPSSDGSEAWG